MLSFDQALTHLLSAAKPVPDIEVVPLKNALGRVLGRDQVAQVSVPPLDNSAMDGYAVRVADLKEVGAQLPVSQRIPAGKVGRPLQAGTCARIFTGAPIPLGADAVVMQEQVTASDDGARFQDVPSVGQNIRKAGEDFLAGQTILNAGQVLRPHHLALAAAAGIPGLTVFRRVKVAVFFTGDELVQPGDPLPPGAIYNSNRTALISLLDSLGCVVSDLGQVADSLEATKQALQQAAVGHDLVLTCGGVSVGEEDHVKSALEAVGRVDMWKIAIKPGKPLAFGYIQNSPKEGAETPFLGLPGNPVAAFVTFLLLVRPFVLTLQGCKQVAPRTQQWPSGFATTKPDVRQEYLRVRLDENGRLALCGNQSSGAMLATVAAAGLAVVPINTVVKEGDSLTFIPFSEVL